MASIINSTTTNGIVVSGDNSGSLQLASNNGTTAITIDASQKVGIGTASPSSYFSGGTNLVIGNASGNTGMTISSGSSSLGRILFADGTSGAEAYQGWVYYTHTDNAMTFATSASERMRITSGGIVCIGKTTASGTTQGIFLQGDGIYAFTKNESGTGPLGYFVNANGTVDNGYRFASFRVTSGFTEVGTITTNGSSTTAYNTSSDYRLKENIAPMTGALATVSALKPVTYKWKIDGSDGQGFIAHELQSIVPDCVTGEKDAIDTEGNPVYQGVDTSFLVATLTAAIQELNAKVEAQAVRIAELEGAQ
jgi:hypothetical protein